MFSTPVAANLVLKTMLALLHRGHGWQGCSQPLADEGGGYPFPEVYHTDFGTPKGICSVRRPHSLSALPLSLRSAVDSLTCVGPSVSLSFLHTHIFFLCGKQQDGSTGVFTREYTKATVAMDCNTGKPTITMK